MHRIRLSENFSYAFGTLLFETVVPEHPEINPELAALVRDRRDAAPARSRSAIDGWQSSPDLGLAGGGAMGILNGHIADAAMAATSAFFGGARDLSGTTIQGNMWGNIYGHCDWAAPHDHRGKGHWSGIYVVDAGDPAPEGTNSGFICFRNPPGTALPGGGVVPFREAELHVTVPPRNGLLLLFSSWQEHFVHPYRGTRERITLAFNVTMDFAGDGGEASVP